MAAVAITAIAPSSAAGAFLGAACGAAGLRDALWDSLFLGLAVRDDCLSRLVLTAAIISA